MRRVLTEPPLAIFVISYNRGAQLQQVIASYRRQAMPVEIVVQDNGSDDPATRDALASLKRNGVRVVHAPPITMPDDLNRVEETIASHLGRHRASRRYAVTDCDIDLSIADRDALYVYAEMLDRFADFACAGPMLRIADIPRAYPLFHHVMNRHIAQFWHRDPRWTATAFGLTAFIAARIDTTFAIHRAGEPFRRRKEGTRLYYPFEAQHLDWYIESDDHYTQASSSHIAHWNNRTQFEVHRGAPLRFSEYKVVGRGEHGALTTQIRRVPPIVST